MSQALSYNPFTSPRAKVTEDDLLPPDEFIQKRLPPIKTALAEGDESEALRIVTDILKEHGDRAALHSDVFGRFAKEIESQHPELSASIQSALSVFRKGYSSGSYDAYREMQIEQFESRNAHSR